MSQLGLFGDEPEAAPSPAPSQPSKAPSPAVTARADAVVEYPWPAVNRRFTTWREGNVTTIWNDEAG